MSQSGYGHQAPTGDRGEIDLSALMREVGRKKWLVLAVTLLAAVLSTVAVSMLKPRYTAETRILVENRDTDYTRFGRESSRGNDPAIDAEQVQSQVQLITSRDLARKMIERFDLGSKREFDKVIDGVDVATRIMVMLGLVDNPANVSPQERVLESYYDKLKAFSLTRSRVLAIEFQSRDPELAAQLANAIAEEYIRQLELAKKGQAQNAGGWLQRTIDPLRQRVAQAEARVEAFRTQNGLFQSGENTTISVQQLSELNTQLATARAQQAELSSKARLIRDAIRQGRIFEVSEVVNNEVVRRLLERRAELKAQLAQEERTLLPQHPRIRELVAQLAGMEEQVRAAADRAARALENDARAAGARVAASQQELDLQKRQSGTASEAEVQLRALEREAKAEREQLETYLARYRDASVRDIENAVAADARIVSRATVPSSPTFPKRLPIIIIATLSAFVLSLFLVLTRALLSDTIYAVPAAAAATPQPMQGMMPYPPMPPQMLQAFYAQQAAMMAQMMPHMVAPQAAAAGGAPVMADGAVAPQQAAREHMRPEEPRPHAASPRSPVPAPAEAPPRKDDLRESLARMRDSLKTPKAEVRDTPVLPAAMPPETAPSKTPVAAGAVVAPVVAEAAPVSPAPVAASAPAVEAPLEPPVRKAVFQSTPVLAPAPTVAVVQDAPSIAGPDDEGYDPFVEIADEAKALLVHGRPVILLVLSVLDRAYAAGSADMLVSHLRSRGSTISMSLDPDTRTAEHIANLARTMSGTHDFVVLNGGNADRPSANLSRASGLTILVAPEDILDLRTDTATLNLAGCNYYIVGPTTADVPMFTS